MLDKRCIYLDHHATTPLDSRVFAKMKPYFLSHFGNAASSSHSYGWHAQDAVSAARIELAAAINADPSEIIFTSGATESINLALKGFFWQKERKNGHKLITSSIEHSSTLAILPFLKLLGLETIIIKPRKDGSIDEEILAKVIDHESAMLSFSMVNNEVGTISDIKALNKIAKKYGAIFHCDMAQAFGRLSIDCQELDVDMISLSGHKIYGPKGIGALYVKRSLLSSLCPLIHGAGQEWFKRSGTLNVPGIVGFAEAAKIATAELVDENTRLCELRDYLWQSLQSLGGIHLNGSLHDRVAANLNISFEDIDGEELLLNLCSTLALSSGSACSSGKGNQSHVLPELGLSRELCQASLRIGLGRFNTKAEIEIAANLIKAEVQRQRG